MLQVFSQGMRYNPSTSSALLDVAKPNLSMHTKFRPIITESARKSSQTESDSAETKVVKPIAIPVWANPGNAVLPLSLHETAKSKAPLLKPVPLARGLNTSLDELHSDTSIEKQNGSLYSHKSTPNTPMHAADTFSSVKTVQSLENLVKLGDLNISECNREDKDTNESDSGYLRDIEEVGSESGNSQEQSETSSARQSNTETSTNLTSISDISGKPPRTESAFPETLIPGHDSENRISYGAEFEVDLDAKSHPHSNGGLIKGLSISQGTEDESKTSNDSSSSEPTSAKSTQQEEPKFSGVLEKEYSSQSNLQDFANKNVDNRATIPPVASPPVSPSPISPRLISSPPLSPSARSNRSSNDGKEPYWRPKLRKSSSGNRISLRRSERKQNSTTTSGDASGNPWFQNRSSNNEENDDDEHSSSESEALNLEQAKRGPIKRLSRLFRSAKSGEIRSQDSMGSSGEFSLPASVSDASSIQTEEVSPKRDASEEHLEETLTLVFSGKRNLVEVIDALLGLSGRPGDKVMKLLTKYMCSAMAIDAAFRVILEHEHARKADIPMISMAPSHARYSPRREALINLFANGPERLKKALLNHNKARSEILRFFTEERPEGDMEIPHWISTATNLSKILNGLLAQFPAELSEYIGGKKGVLHLMIKNHIHVPEVVEFVVQLSAANALSKTTGEDLRYGAANATGLVLLVKEGICDLLVDIFRKSSVATAQGTTHVLEWQTQVMSTQCLLELSKRAICIPRFTRDNCSYSGRYIKTLNSSLEELSLFTKDSRVLSLLNSGFEAISDGPEIENVQEQSERNNPLVCALAVIIELLETVRTAAGSKLAVTRRTVGGTDTTKIEKHLVAKMARLCKLLHRKSAHEVSSRTKVAIVNVFRCLCSSNVESTRLAMVKSQVPDRLMMLIRENERSSVVHSCVLKCLSTSFNSAQSVELHKEWLRALARSDGWLQVMYEYFHNVEGGDAHRRKAFFSTFVEIGLCVMEFCKDDKETKLRCMLKTKSELQTYVDGIEAGLVSLRKDVETPCGGPKPTERAVSVLANAETLAARLHDFNAV